MIYLLSDLHGELYPELLEYAKGAGEGDLLILLGDIGLAFDKSEENGRFTEEFLSLGIKIAFIDGNHENFEYLAPHSTFFHDEIFEENILFSLFQFCKNCLPLRFSRRKIRGLCLVKNRVATAFFKITGKWDKFGGFGGEFVGDVLALCECVSGESNLLFISFFECSVTKIAFGIPKKNRSEKGKEKYDHDPREFGGWIDLRVNKSQKSNN